MFIKPDISSFCLRRSIALLLVVVFHAFIFIVFNRPVKLEPVLPSKTHSYTLMNIFSVKSTIGEKAKITMEKKDIPNAAHFASLKNSRREPIGAEPREFIDVSKAEQTAEEQVKGAGDTLSSKELASLESLARRYNLEIPKAPFTESLMPAPTPAQQAAQDPRTNSPHLTKSEKFAVAMGNLDCIFQTRLANGNVIRVPGQWIEVPARSELGFKSLRKVRFCVRFNQGVNENTDDMSAINAGLKGKL